MKFCYNTSNIFPKQSQRSYPSYKMNLDLWDCFGRKKKPLSYNRRNMVACCYVPATNKKSHMFNVPQSACDLSYSNTNAYLIKAGMASEK